MRLNEELDYEQPRTMLRILLKNVNPLHNQKESVNDPKEDQTKGPVSNIN